MIGLPYGEKTVTICWAVFIWYRNVTDGQNCYINIARQYMLTCDKNSKWSRSYSHSGQSRLYMHRLHSRRQTPVLYHIAYIYLRYMPALQRNSGHCIHQLLPPTKVQPMKLRDSHCVFALPQCHYNLYKHSFVLRNLFVSDIVFFVCFLVLNSLFMLCYAFNLLMAFDRLLLKGLLTYLLTYLLTQQCHFEWPWVILSDLAKYSMTQSVARSLSDSLASCCVNDVHATDGEAEDWMGCNT